MSKKEILKNYPSYESQVQLLHDGAKFTFVAMDNAGDALVYEIFEYSDEQDIALFVIFEDHASSGEGDIIYESVYADLASLLKGQPFSDLSKFVVVRQGEEE